MNKLNPANLAQFTGTTAYWRIGTSAVLTDGAKYVADAAGAYWLMDAIASYVLQFTGREEFVVAKLIVTANKAELTLDDGNSNVLDRQHIAYTDFPIQSFQMYACWSGEYWVLMLPTEY